MQSFFLDPPIFSEPNGNTVKLVLKNNIAARSIRRLNSQSSEWKECWKSLSRFDQEIIFYIANIDRCTPRQLTDMTKKSRPTVLKHVNQLIDKGILEEHSASLRDPTKYYTIK